MAPVAYVGAAAAVAGAASQIANSGSSPNGTQGGNPATYIPTNQAGADQLFQNTLFSNMIPTANALPGQILPQYQQAQQNISNNPYAGLAVQGSVNAAGLAPGVSGMQMSGANSLFGAGNQVLGSAFDPQNALYNRTQQQVMDQINAANAASGVAGPAAAGVAQQGLTNFNIDWQNNLLQRQALGIRAGGQAFSGASDLGLAGMNTLQTGSQLPYATFLGQQRDDISGLDALSQGTLNAYALPQQSLQDLQSYLGLGQSASSLARVGQGQAFNQNQILGQNLSTALTNPALQSGLNSLFSSNSSPMYAGVSANSNADYASAFPGFDFSQAG